MTRSTKPARIDQGTGSTFDALAARGLIQVAIRLGGLHGGTLHPHLRMTTAGRRLCRQITGQRAYKPPPAGTLKEWHWRALAKAYVAGAEGLEGDYGVFGHIGERTWERLLEYKWGALVEERRTGSLTLGRTVRMYVTARGRALYHDEWARYRAMYPDVEAPEPDSGEQ
jgi:hypothetical protein